MDNCTFSCHKLVGTKLPGETVASFQKLVDKRIITQEQADEILKVSLQCVQISIYITQRTQEGISRGSDYEGRVVAWKESLSEQNCPFADHIPAVSAACIYLDQ